MHHCCASPQLCASLSRRFVVLPAYRRSAGGDLVAQMRRRSSACCPQVLPVYSVPGRGIALVQDMLSRELPLFELEAPLARMEAVLGPNSPAALVPALAFYSRPLSGGRSTEAIAQTPDERDPLKAIANKHASDEAPPSEFRCCSMLAASRREPATVASRCHVPQGQHRASRPVSSRRAVRERPAGAAGCPAGAHASRASARRPSGVLSACGKTRTPRNLILTFEKSRPRA